MKTAKKRTRQERKEAAIVRWMVDKNVALMRRKGAMYGVKCDGKPFKIFSILPGACPWEVALQEARPKTLVEAFSERICFNCDKRQYELVCRCGGNTEPLDGYGQI